MKIVEIRLQVTSVEEAKEFYCNELGLFSFYRDYGMETISLTYNKNNSIRLLIVQGNLSNMDYPLFNIEVDSCDNVFKILQDVKFKTNGKLISDEVFEYPLEKNILVQDPSKNKFLIVEFNNPNNMGF